MDKLEDNNKVNNLGINIDFNTVSLIQQKADILYKIDSFISKISQLGDDSIDVYSIASHLNKLFVRINDDLDELQALDKELDMYIKQVSNNIDSEPRQR